MRNIIFLIFIFQANLLFSQVRKYLINSDSLTNSIYNCKYGENSYFGLIPQNCTDGNLAYVNYSFNGSINYVKNTNHNGTGGQVIHLGYDEFAYGFINSTENKFYISKVNSNGNTVWSKSMFLSTVNSSTTFNIASDSIGNIYAFTYDLDSIRLYKYRPNGLPAFYNTFNFSLPTLNTFQAVDIDIINSNNILISGSKNGKPAFIKIDSTGNLIESRFIKYYSTGDHNLWYTNVINSNELLICGKLLSGYMFVSEYNFNGDSIKYYNILDTSGLNLNFAPREIIKRNNDIIIFSYLNLSNGPTCSILYLDSNFTPKNHWLLTELLPANYFSFKDSLVMYANGGVFINNIDNIIDCNAYPGPLPKIQIITLDTLGSIYNGQINQSRIPLNENINDSNYPCTNYYLCNTSEMFLDINSFDDLKNNFFPNPTSNFLTIESSFIDFSITIFNLQGQIVFHSIEKLNKIDVSGFTKGIYLIQLNDGVNITTQKFVKE